MGCRFADFGIKIYLRQNFSEEKLFGLCHIVCAIQHVNWLSSLTCGRGLDKNNKESPKSLYLTFMLSSPLRTEFNQTWDVWRLLTVFSFMLI